jgi:signal transduction histidine kinase
VVAGLSVMLWRNNRQKHQANKQLRRQQQELQATQAQLVQAEKLAALGELTAGIAHEMQNPLNFVTNFAEVSADLSQELQEEARAGNYEEVEDLAGELAQNMQKIIHHGQRASGIVLGMLDHARPSNGQRQAVDLNALADEYLRTAYESWCIQHPHFTATLATDFAPELDSIEMVPTDIGRVLLNLYTNAFYALQQKTATHGEDYEPQIIVRTRHLGQQAELSVRDNGIGMSMAVMQKIFQPFFTTKAPGEGTGLGLSLSYDIVTQGHGGSMSVNSQEGEGTEVLLTLPLKHIIKQKAAQRDAERPLFS